MYIFLFFGGEVSLEQKKKHCISLPLDGVIYSSA